jgi:hypothetical protein
MVLAEPWTFLLFCHPQSGQFFLLWQFLFLLSVWLDPLERCVCGPRSYAYRPAQINCE